MAQVVDPTQQAEGDVSGWVHEPLEERHASLIVHTRRPFNAEPTNGALQHMITPATHHYRRQHSQVPLVDEAAYRLAIGIEGDDAPEAQFSLSDLHRFKVHDAHVTLMCTGNRRSEFNNHGETAGLPWANGSISTAKWSGVALADVLREAGINESLEEKGFRFITFWGLEDYHISVPLRVALSRNNDVLLASMMNGGPLPRDHGFPLRVVVPGYVGARSVKWLSRIVIMKNEVDGMHQKGIAYKQLAPNVKKLSGVPAAQIHALPPIDHVPITSAITSPEPGTTVLRGTPLKVTGYAYSGAGHAVIRVDVSVDGGKTWEQAEFTRASEKQSVRSGRAWAWVQWQLTTPVPERGEFEIVCKAIDDQYNQQPHDPEAIWNVRGILNTSWGRAKVQAADRAKL